MEVSLTQTNKEIAMTRFLETCSSVTLADVLLSRLNGSKNARFDIRCLLDKLAEAMDRTIANEVEARMAQFVRTWRGRQSDLHDSIRVIGESSKQ
jgi:hypothetical protein